MKIYYVVSPVLGKGTITANGGNGYCAGQQVCTTKFNKQFKVCVVVGNRFVIIRVCRVTSFVIIALFKQFKSGYFTFI